MFHFGGESVSLRSKNAALIYVRKVLRTNFVGQAKSNISFFNRQPFSNGNKCFVRSLFPLIAL